MSVFSEAELAYLRECRLSRLATVDATGQPHVVPIGMWRCNPELDTIDIGGHDFARTRKFRNVQAYPQAADVADDLASVDPRRPRCVQVRGTAQALDAASSPDGGWPVPDHPDLTPRRWGLDHP